jgi:flagellar assembly protein FliH
MLAESPAAQMVELLKCFAEDFGADADAPVIPTGDAAPEEPAPDPEAIRSAAYQDGLRDGLEHAKARHDQVVERALAALQERLAAAQYQAAHESERAARSIARLLIQTLMKMLPAACARCGASEIAEIARTVLPALRHEPRVVLAVHPALAADVGAELARLGDGFKERTVVAPTDALAPGDVRITWQDGSAVRDTTDLLQRIAALFAQYGLIDAPGHAPAD